MRHTIMPNFSLASVKDCPLHRRTPYGMTNVSHTQFSIARYSGCCRINGEIYTYLPGTDELIRNDVLKWLKKRKQDS
jgi:hypothetical protein